MKNKRPPTSALFTRPDQAIMQYLCGRLGSERPGQQWGIIAVRKPSWPIGALPGPLRPLSHCPFHSEVCSPCPELTVLCLPGKAKSTSIPLAPALRILHAFQPNSNPRPYSIVVKGTRTGETLTFTNTLTLWAWTSDSISQRPGVVLCKMGWREHPAPRGKWDNPCKERVQGPGTG